ncbi:MAG TPA: hypothetical protein HA262_00615 [Methanosarcina sp.]|jgi:hypothetical protein|nr:hypothetical protein [Methanosarcina sp.]
MLRFDSKRCNIDITANRLHQYIATKDQINILQETDYINIIVGKYPCGVVVDKNKLMIPILKIVKVKVKVKVVI